jgi:uncharacterized iron-regulated membrane protein
MLTRIRTLLFWTHLAAGVVAGAAIFTMSVTGALIALQPQILNWVERDQRRATPSGTLQSPGALLAAATRGAALPETVTITISADPGEAAVVSLGRGLVRYVDPYTGVVLGDGSPAARRTFQWLTEFHRWFAAGTTWRSAGRSVTGWSTLAFVGLVLSGMLLWVPRSGSRLVWVRSLTPSWPSTPRARDFNWHTVVGFWCAPVLFVLALSGVVLAFPWANRMLYAAAGTPMPIAPARAEGRPGAGRAAPSGGPAMPDFRQADAGWADARQRIPSWDTIAIRIPTRGGGPVSFTITDAAHWNRFARSQLMASATGEVLRWEPYSDQTRGQRWRLWARFAHTGELGGLAGQVIAGAASAGAALLAWTGMSLALRRLARTRSTRRDTARAA